MYDFFDMVTLSAVTDEVVESLNDGRINAALDSYTMCYPSTPLMLPLRIATCTQRKMPSFDLHNGF